jgi:hypothetical protein
MKSSRKLNQVVAGTLATSILTGSCTQYPYIEGDRIYGNIVVDDSDLGEITIPISLKIKPEDVQYINAIQQISIDILNNPRKAKEFQENPSSYLKKYGYNGEFDLDDNLLKITMALSDEDINNAIQEQDFKTFIKLCKDKNIISFSKGIFENKYYKEQIEKINEREDIKKLTESLRSNSGQSTDEEGFAFFLPVIAIIAAAAAVIAAIWAYLAFHVHTYAYEYTHTQTSGISIPTAFGNFDDLSIIDVYALKAGMKDTYIAVDNYTEEMVNESIRAIKEIQPNFFDNNSETEVKNLLKINILNNIANI